MKMAPDLYNIISRAVGNGKKLSYALSLTLSISRDGLDQVCMVEVDMSKCNIWCRFLVFYSTKSDTPFSTSIKNKQTIKVTGWCSAHARKLLRTHINTYNTCCARDRAREIK